jgi:hypothetical protein
MQQTVCDRCHVVVQVATVDTPVADMLNSVVHIESVIPDELVPKVIQAYQQIGQTYKPLSIDLCPACRIVMRAALNPL